MTSEQVLKFTSQMRLDPQSLYNILGVERRPLFNCALYLLKTILSIVQEESEQKPTPPRLYRSPVSPFPVHLSHHAYAYKFTTSSFQNIYKNI